MAVRVSFGTRAPFAVRASFSVHASFDVGAFFGFAFRFDTVEGLRLYLLCNAYADVSPVLGIVAFGRAIML